MTLMNSSSLDESKGECIPEKNDYTLADDRKTVKGG